MSGEASRLDINSGGDTAQVTAAPKKTRKKRYRLFRLIHLWRKRGKSASRSQVLRAGTISAYVSRRTRITGVPLSNMSVSAQIRQFRKNGLSLIEAYFNAYYIYFTRKARLDGDREVRPEYQGIAEHPVNWSRDNSVLYKRSIWDNGQRLLERMARALGHMIGFGCSLKGRFAQAAKRLTDRAPVLTRIARHFGTLTAAAVIVFCAVMMHRVYSGEVQIRAEVDGMPMGIVQSKAQFDRVLSKLEYDLSLVTGVGYKFGHEINYSLVMTHQTDSLTDEQIYEGLSTYSQDVVAQAWGLYVDGSLVGASLDQSEITEVLQGMLDEQEPLAEVDSKVEFDNEIEITRAVFPRRMLMSPSQLRDRLEYAATDGVLYDAGQAIPPSADSSDKDVMDDDAIPRSLAMEGGPAIPLGLDSSHTYYIPEEKLLGDVTAEEHALKLKTIVTETYNERIQYDVVYQDSEEHFVGTSVVSQYGKVGQALVTAEVSYIEGREVSREVLTYEVLTPAVEQIILRGVKPIPKTEPTGTFIPPIENPTWGDGFGNRVLRGSKDFHRAQDFPAAKGTPVLASDGGTVITAGWSGNYGNYVLIDHGRGMQTGYAHMDKVLVSPGEKVYQGQLIGKVGSTGDSTGYHLHFMVFKYFEKVDPKPFIKGK